MNAVAIQPFTVPTPNDIMSDDDLAKRALASARIRWELSARETEVLSHLAEGDANKDIAASLHCSERNVEFHVGRILRAARVSSRSELLVKVLGAR